MYNHIQADSLVPISYSVHKERPFLLLQSQAAAQKPTVHISGMS